MPGAPPDRQVFLFCNPYRNALLRSLQDRNFSSLRLTILDSAQLDEQFLAKPELDRDTTSVLVSDEDRPPRDFHALFWNSEKLQDSASSASKAFYIIRSPFVERRQFQTFPVVIGAPDQWLGNIVFASEILASVSPDVLQLFNQLVPTADSSISAAESTLIASLAVTHSPEQAHKIYQEFQACLRLFLVFQLRNRYGERFLLYGNDWGRFEIQAQPSNYNPLIYFGNICVDLGSWSGIGSLYPRAIQILETGGILLQKKNSTSGILGPALEDLCLFDTAQELYDRIDALVAPEVRLRYFRALIERFGDSDREQESHLLTLLYE